MSKQISSVDYLISQVEDFIGLIPSDIISKAKAMHKQEIEDAYIEGFSNGFLKAKEGITFDFENAEDYYKQTFEQ